MEWGVLKTVSLPFSASRSPTVLKQEKNRLGVLLWHSGLRIRYCHCSSLGGCCGTGSVLDTGSTCRGHGQTKKERRENKRLKMNLGRVTGWLRDLEWGDLSSSLREVTLLADYLYLRVHFSICAMGAIVGWPRRSWMVQRQWWMEAGSSFYTSVPGATAAYGTEQLESQLSKGWHPSFLKCGKSRSDKLPFPESQGSGPSDWDNASRSHMPCDLLRNKWSKRVIANPAGTAPCSSSCTSYLQAVLWSKHEVWVTPHVSFSLRHREVMELAYYFLVRRWQTWVLNLQNLVPVALNSRLPLQKIRMARKKLGPSSSVRSVSFPLLLLTLWKQHFHPYTAGKTKEPEPQVKTWAFRLFPSLGC